MEHVLADHENEALLREIDEELRQDKALQIWQSYSKVLIAAAVVIVSSVAGYKFWSSQELQAREAAGTQFTEANQKASANESEDALKAFQTLADEGGGYGLLASFQAATLLHQQGDIDGATAVYRGIESDTSHEKIYRDLAILLEANMMLDNDGADLAAQKERLAPLEQTDNPLRFSAREAAALIALKQGDKAAAIEVYKALAEDAVTPDRLRGRAQEMLAALD